MGKVLEARLGIAIREDEIGYLALHIGAAIERKRIKSKAKRCVIVCATGVASSHLLYYKLKATFDEQLDIVGMMNVHDLMNYPVEILDFIVSTVPIDATFPIPVIEMNTLLGSQDLSKLKGMIVDNVDSVLKYIEPELFFFQQDLKSKEEVIDFLVEKLDQLGKIPPNFKEALYEREAISPTSFGNLVAIPHPMRQITEETLWAVCTLKKNIEWGKNRVQLVYLLSVQKSYTDELQKMFQFLVRVVEDPVLVEQLLKITDYQSFIDLLKLHEHLPFA